MSKGVITETTSLVKNVDNILTDAFEVVCLLEKGTPVDIPECCYNNGSQQFFSVIVGDKCGYVLGKFVQIIELNDSDYEELGKSISDNLWSVVILALLSGKDIVSAEEDSIEYVEKEEIFEYGGLGGAGETGKRAVKVYQCTGCKKFIIEDRDLYCRECGHEAPSHSQKFHAKKFCCPNDIRDWKRGSYGPGGDIRKSKEVKDDQEGNPYPWESGNRKPKNRDDQEGNPYPWQK